MGEDVKFSWLLPFGKKQGYLGKTLTAVAREDPSFLRWALESIDDMDERWPGLYQEIREALARQGELNG